MSIKKTSRPLANIAAAIQTAGGNPPIHAALQHFDRLPDSASARVPVVAALFSVSVPTIWRWSRDGKLPAPTKRGGVTLWSVGQLRAALADPGHVKATRTAGATAAAAAKRSTAPAV